MKKVSILVPIYGVEKYIEQCVRSLFEQTYANIEYIFVNDCTQDHSVEILENVMPEYPDRAKQVHVISHSKNQGVGAARQTALLAATGDYIMFADSDDFLPAQAVELLIKKAEENDADLIDGAYAEWNNEKALQPQPPIDINKKKYLQLLICQNIITNRLWGRLYKRSIVMEHQVFFQEGINYAEDLFWNTQFLFYANRTCINEVVYYYRTDNVSSYTHNISEKNLLSYFKSSQLMAQFFLTHDTDNIYRKAIDIAIANVYREAAQAHIDLQRIDQLLAFKPKSKVIQFVISLIKKGCPVKWTNLIYLAYRKIYTR